MFRRTGGQLQVLLVHPGGPFWRRKDLGAWTIPKGERIADEGPEATARREFAEETGHTLDGPLIGLGRIKQRGGKQVDAFAIEGDFDTERLVCNSFEIEWPPRSGKRQSFPEVDKAAWFTLEEARAKINTAQIELLDRLAALALLPDRGPPGPLMSSRAKARDP
jgi:predicted NUDIX family NTP pyrophosphohydrolase